METRNHQEQFNLREVILREFKDERLQFRFVFFQRVQVSVDDLELLCLFMGKDTINSFLNLGNRRFTEPMYERHYVQRFSMIFQQLHS